MRKGLCITYFLLLSACTPRGDLAPVDEGIQAVVAIVPPSRPVIIPAPVEEKKPEVVKPVEPKPEAKPVELVIKPPEVKPLAAKPVPKPAPKPAPKPVPKQEAKYRLPASGKIVSTFSPEQGEKGINIAGKKGEQIHAMADGVVVYAGDGLQGYGNLIIIKHDNQYLTAYGNNRQNLVHEGDRIKSGQVIAEMGIIAHKYYGVHFEVRKAGKPVNPLEFLAIAAR